MKQSLTVVGLLAFLLLGSSISTSAQIDQNWNWELESGISRSISNPNQSRFHLGIQLPSARNYRWHRISLGLANEFYPGFYYREDPDAALVQDSGMTQLLSLTYGMEFRTYKSDIVAIYAGAEVGAGIAFTDHTITTWSEANLNSTPTIERNESINPRALINPYIGMKVWLSDRIGVYGEGWLMTSLYGENSANSSTFNLDQSPELRIGITFKMGMK